jgi:arylsulfatase A
MIVRWPGKIHAGSKTDHISAFWDVLPTLAELSGTKTPEKIDGISFLPTLLGEKGQKQHKYLYWEFHERAGRKAIRKGIWKLVKYNIQNPDLFKIELFDLSKDVGEQNDLSALKPEIVIELSALMDSARTDSEVFKF